MKVFLTSAYGDDYISEWLRSNDPYASSIITNDPAEADVIIFAETHPPIDQYFDNVFKNKIYKKYRSKCVLYHDADRAITTLPTLAPTIESWQFNPRHKRTAHYIARLCENDAVNNAIIDFRNERKYLYSFYGNRTHEVRNRIFSMSHPSDTYMKDMAGINMWEISTEERLAFGLEYVQVMQESYFALTPRGIGPSSYRLFETLQLGRVPVIISDGWVRIPDIDWDAFSITIPEKKVHQLPFVLKERKGEAVEMGKLARKHWEEYFSPEVSLRQLAKAAGELIKHKYTIVDSVVEHTQFIRSPWHLRNYIRVKAKKLFYKQA